MISLKTRLYNIRARCLDKKLKRYGGRGIECRITLDELKFLWARDNADKLKRPSIDRIDNDGHYELSNCRFIEVSENGRKGAKKDTTRCIHGHLYTEDNIEWSDKAKTRIKCRTCHRISNAKTNPKWNPMRGKKK